MNKPYELYLGDCLEIMDKLIEQGVKVDCILTDPPYGTTACKWDSIIPLEDMWSRLNKLIKPNGAIVLFADGARYSALLIHSNIKDYRHKWIWNKNNSAGFATAKIRPFQICEDILVFGRNRVNYYPIMEERGKPRNKGGYTISENYNIVMFLAAILYVSNVIPCSIVATGITATPLNIESIESKYLFTAASIATCTFLYFSGSKVVNPSLDGI